MPAKSDTPLNSVQLTMLALGTVIVLFLWVLFLWQTSATRVETLNARLSENRNLALIVSESLKQMTDRAKAMGSLVNDDVIAHQEAEIRLLTLLAEDPPVFNRLSVYNLSGELIYTSHLDSARSKLGGWLSETEDHFAGTGFVPVLPERVADPAYVPAEPAWRLPFLVPLRLADLSRSSRLILIELDIATWLGFYRMLSWARALFRFWIPGGG